MSFDVFGAERVSNVVRKFISSYLKVKKKNEKNVLLIFVSNLNKFTNLLVIASSLLSTIIKFIDIVIEP